MDLAKPHSRTACCAWRQIFALLLTCLLLSGCVLSPPVQEMSNARQTIQAARDAKALEYAPQYLREAESLMKSASDALDTGDYYNARELAIAAQQQAIKARQQAISRQKDAKSD